MRATPSQKNRLRRRKLALAATYWAPHIGSMNEEYDYVIVGAGSAGCVLADRLTEDGRHTVALLEYGGSDRSIFIQMPAALSIPMNMKTYNWGYVSEPEPQSERPAHPLSARQGSRRLVLDQRPRLCARPSARFRTLGGGGRQGLGISQRAALLPSRGELCRRRRRLARRRRAAGDGARSQVKPALRRLHRGGPRGRLSRSAAISTASGRRGSDRST